MTIPSNSAANNLLKALRAALKQRGNPAFDEKHPRGRDGEFAPKGKGKTAARPANLAGLVLPATRGRWIGERGNGTWLSRSLKARALAPGGVDYKNGFPDFEPHLHHIEEEDAMGHVRSVAGEVEMPTGFIGERPKDFAIADRIIAQKMGWLKRDGTPNAAKAERYRVEKRLVWHHHEDCSRPRMLLIPAVVHARAPHSGGHSLCA